MRAVCWYGKRDVRVEEVQEPVIVNPRDAIVAVSTAGICRSDLSQYDGGDPNMRPGSILGHEFVGEVVDIGSEVELLPRGRRVVVSSVISCGRCWYCKREEWSCCDNTNPRWWSGEKLLGSVPAGRFGSSRLFGGYAGGHAEYVRVPFADVGCLSVDESLPDERVMVLAEALPAAFMAAEQGDIEPGDTVVVWGCGPLGQLAITCARAYEPGYIIAVDNVPGRLLMARDKAGADAVVDYDDGALEVLMEMTGGRGADVVIDSAGSEHFGHAGRPLPRGSRNGPITPRGSVPREVVLACRKGGRLSLIHDPAGYLDAVSLDAAVTKGVAVKAGPVHVHRYMRPLHRRIERDELDPSFIVTHRLVLADAPAGYDLLERKDGVVKVLLQP